jgi:hypothetical protein
MNKNFNLPWEWRQQSQYFITYFGDIYYGLVDFCPGHDDCFFIIQNDNIRILQGLTKEERTLERYRQLGWEIRDRKVIVDTLPRDYQLGTSDGHQTLHGGGRQAWNKAFIFGAGASANCAFGDKIATLKSSSLRPPIGYEIFDERFEEIVGGYPGAKFSIADFEAKGNNIEVCFEEEWEALRYYKNPQIVSRHINIQFYLQELFREISNDITRKHYRKNCYGLFANRLQKYLASRPDERVACVSFNYDTILDHFLQEAFRQPYESIENYFDWHTHQALLFKPHGSWNWGWKFNKQMDGWNRKNTLSEFLYNEQYDLATIYYKLMGDIDQMVYDHAWGIEMSHSTNRLGRYTINKNMIELIASDPSADYFPALLMPYRDKDEFVMHYAHQFAMEIFFNEVKELYLIGWKGNEAVFNRLLKNHAHKLSKITIVNPEAEEVKKNLDNYLDISKCEIKYVKTFEEFVLVELDKIFQ